MPDNFLTLAKRTIMETITAPFVLAQPHFQTVAEFEQGYEQANEGNYEFVRGRIIPKPAMKQNEFYIVKFLTRLFMKTEAFGQGYELLQEGDSYIDPERKRIPDLALFSADQIKQARHGIQTSTSFAIEILSDSEKENDVIEKIAERGPQDYFDAGVKLVWYIAPRFQKIYAYSSPDDIRVFRGEQVISAAPVLPDFQFALADMFRE
jgi:Uma2 family endonuclease